MFRPYETYKRLGECGETRLKSATARAADGRDLKE